VINMAISGEVPSMEREIFRHENRWYRYPLLITSLLISIYFYSRYNLFVGSFFLFMFLYLIGTFKGRKKIDLLLNEDPVNVAAKITGLVNSARSEIKILSGSINPQVYCHEDVLNALNNSLKRGVEVYFITDWEAAEKNALVTVTVDGNNAEKREHTIIKWAEGNRLKIYDYGDNVNNTNHFIVVDKKSFRVEGKHEKNSDSRLAVTAYNNKRASKFLKFFDGLIADKEVKLIYPKKRFTL